MDRNRIDLSGTWELSEVGGKIRVAAAIPGDTHSALLAAGVIPDPYIGRNERDVQWVGNRDWRFARRFSVPADFLAAPSVFLHCDVLDTVATVHLNGHLVGRSDNMFVRRRFEIRNRLQAGENLLEVRFRSAAREAGRRSRRLAYPIPHLQLPHITPHLNLLRKVQCHGGWDWGPTLLVAGLYGAVYLGRTEVARIEHVCTRQEFDGPDCRLHVSCEVVAPTAAETYFECRIRNAAVRETVRLQRGRNTLCACLEVPAPPRWWPAGSGDQPLFDLHVSVGDDDRVRKRIGFRTLELISDEDTAGRSFLFRVNGADIFCKGANWIPCDALPSRQTRARLDELLTSAAAANMNMIRVWGGGQYEPDEFYDFCDEKGLLVWQDFMFSCALYPATDTFLASVREEAEFQIKRLRDHACLALWCGDNENIGALTWFEESKANRDRYLLDYDRLNHGVLAAAVCEFDPTHAFWTSSPCGGPGDFSDCWHIDNRGDMHYWDAWADGDPVARFRAVKPRFCSEFGFQALPSITRIRALLDGAAEHLTVPELEHHQRGGPQATGRIVTNILRCFPFPAALDGIVYLSQLGQALAVGAAVEAWRCLRPYCMGTLYWQLNDCWPAVSWSSIEYGGKWKLLHHVIRRAYAPVLVTPQPRPDGTIEIWGVNDRAQPGEGRLELELWDFDGTCLRQEQTTVHLPAASARSLRTLRPKTWAARPENTMLHLRLEHDGGRAENVHFFGPCKSCQLAPVPVQAAVRATEAGFAVALTVTRPACYVTLDAAGIAGAFDDNVITLRPGVTRTLAFPARESLSAADFQAALTVRHLARASD